MTKVMIIAGENRDKYQSGLNKATNMAPDNFTNLAF